MGINDCSRCGRDMGPGMCGVDANTRQAICLACWGQDKAGDFTYTVRLFIPRHWQDKDGNWVDMAEYCCTNDGCSLLMTADFVWDGSPDPDPMVAVLRLLPDWERAKLIRYDDDPLTESVLALLNQMAGGD